MTLQKIHYMMPAASYLVLLDGTKVLLSRRFNTGFEDGNYSLIAGHVDEGESFTQTMIREAEEEAGIIVTPEQVEVAHVMHRKNSDAVRVNVFFVARQWQGQPEIKEPDKCDDLSWFEMNGLPANVIPYIKQAVESIKNRVFYSEYGWE